MKMIVLLLKKSVLVALVAALSLAALPATSTHASGLGDPGDPPSGTTQISNTRLEHIWARMQRVYARQGRLLARADRWVEKLQNRIDRMSENGKDTAALQAALDTFEEALQDAHAVHESAQGIIATHPGFDTAGNVSDHDQAVETVRDLRDKLQEVRQIVGEPGRALRAAIKAYRLL